MKTTTIFMFTALFFLALSCKSDDDPSHEVAKVYPEQLEFVAGDYTYNYEKRQIGIKCLNSSEWYISAVIEVSGDDSVEVAYGKEFPASGSWYTINKEGNNLLLGLARNELKGVRSLIIKVDSEHSEGEDIYVRQYPGFNYVEEDDAIKSQIVGKWCIIADNWSQWVESDSANAPVVEFTADGFYRESDSNYRKYKVSSDYIYFKLLDGQGSISEGSLFSDEWLCLYQLDGDRFKVEVLLGGVVLISGYLYQRID